MSKLKIAVQKAGRLNEDSLQLLKDCGISIDNGKDQLKASASNFPLEVLYLRNGDIPQYLKDGVVDIAIIGDNVLIEKGNGITVVEKLGFSKCRVSLAVPKGVNYKNINDLDGMRIATSYPNTVKEYFKKFNLTPDIHIISGSVEIAPSIGLADAICDIVSSGSTLFKNNLKEVEGIQSVLKARKSRYILMNAPNDKIAEIIKILPGMRSPTVLPLAEAGWSSIHTVIEKDRFWEVIDELKLLGAEGLLVVPIEKMVI